MGVCNVLLMQSCTDCHGTEALRDCCCLIVKQSLDEGCVMILDEG